MTVTSSQQPHHQVAIVGGGIAGLTLALAFEQLNIDYILFEAYESLAPNEGASIGLLPNGLRILDQLGLLESIEDSSAALQKWTHVNGDGSVIAITEALGYYRSKIGYGGHFLERQKLLQMMSEKLQDKGSIHTSCRVSSIEEFADHVSITTESGFSVTADVVVGADGVRSIVRRCIGSVQTDSDLQIDDCMTTRFACVYGISDPTTGIQEGDCFSVYREHTTIVGFTGKDGVVFWFVIEDLGQEYALAKRLRYDEADLEAVCASVAELDIYPSVRFADVYNNKRIARKVALEEGIAKCWHTGRTVIIGDAAHKMVPNAAMGGNQAIESAAVLANELSKALDDSSKSFTATNLKNALLNFSQQRKARSTEMMQRAGIVCRAQLCHGGPALAIRESLADLSDGDWLLRGFASFAAAPVLQKVPLTVRGLEYNKAVEEWKERMSKRERGELNVSNSVLMGVN